MKRSEIANNWEVDWTKRGHGLRPLWARNPTSHLPQAREWHWVSYYTARIAGINVPTFRADSWEIDWEQRNGKKVWARNLQSEAPKARQWHWIDYHQVQKAGLKWKPKRESKLRGLNKYGYYILSRRQMTDADIALASEHGLWLGRKGQVCMEHRLAAVKKYGRLPKGAVVRHKNGIKTDNRPENLVLGTTQENTRDHNSSRLAAMYWRGKYEQACKEILELRQFSLLPKHAADVVDYQLLAASVIRTSHLQAD